MRTQTVDLLGVQAWGLNRSLMAPQGSQKHHNTSSSIPCTYETFYSQGTYMGFSGRNVEAYGYYKKKSFLRTMSLKKIVEIICSNFLM